MMSALSPALPAAAEAFQAVRRYLSHDVRSPGNTVLFAAVAVIVVAWVGLVLWDRRNRAAGLRTVNTGLFDELCRAHGLSLEDRGLLRRAVSGRQPAVAFIDPEHLSRHAAAHDADADACAALRERLFGLVGHTAPAAR